MVFYHDFLLMLLSPNGVKWVCIHTGNSSGYIGQTHSRFPKYLWMFDTESNPQQTDILDNLFN